MENLIFLAGAVFVLLACITVIVASFMLVRIAKVQQGVAYVHQQQSNDVFVHDEIQPYCETESNAEPIIQDVPKETKDSLVAEVNDAADSKSPKSFWKLPFKERGKKCDMPDSTTLEETLEDRAMEAGGGENVIDTSIYEPFEYED